MYLDKLEKIGNLYHPLSPREEAGQITTLNELWTQNAAICYDENEFEKFLRIDCGGVAAMAYQLESLEACQIGADLIAWLFMFDDRFGEGPYASSHQEAMQQMRTYVDLVKLKSLPQNYDKFHESLLELVSRALEIGPDKWDQLFASSLERYIDGCLQEYRMRYENYIPATEEYVCLRRQSIGAYPILDIVDLCHDAVLADQNLIRCGRDMTADLLGWVNDIFSYKKEFLDDDPCNLVKVIVKDKGVAIEQAYDIAIAMHDLKIKEFYSLYNQIQNDPDHRTETKCYFESLRNWIMANYVWAKTTRRYHF